MRYDPAPFALGARDVVGAWLVCFGFAVACLAAMSATALEPSGAPAALINSGVVATLAVADATRQGRC